MSSANTFRQKHEDNKRMAAAGKSRNGSRIKSRPGYKFRVFCATCPVEMFAGQQVGAVSVVPGERTARCKHGHETPVRW